MWRLLAFRLPWVAIAAGLMAACGVDRAVTELDDRTGITLVRSPEALVFARTEPRYSRSGRDYLYLGPVETNRQGLREYYLWVGVGTTLDRGFLAPAADAPQTLYLELDGAPVELKLRPWQDVVGTERRRRDTYPTSVPLEAELVARVTLQQLTLFDAEPMQSLRIDLGTEGTPRTYLRWDKGGNFARFLAAVAPDAR